MGIDHLIPGMEPGRRAEGEGIVGGVHGGRLELGTRRQEDRLQGLMVAAARRSEVDRVGIGVRVGRGVVELEPAAAHVPYVILMTIGQAADVAAAVDRHVRADERLGIGIRGRVRCGDAGGHESEGVAVGARLLPVGVDRAHRGGPGDAEHGAVGHEALHMAVVRRLRVRAGDADERARRACRAGAR